MCCDDREPTPNGRRCSGGRIARRLRHRGWHAAWADAGHRFGLDSPRGLRPYLVVAGRPQCRQLLLSGLRQREAAQYCSRSCLLPLGQIAVRQNIAVNAGEQPDGSVGV